MIKKIQSIVAIGAILLSGLSMKAQNTGSITITSVPATAVAGEAVTVDFDYTSSIDGYYEIQLLKVIDGAYSYSANWYFGQDPVALGSGSVSVAATIDPNDVPIVPTADLPPNEHYEWRIQLKSDPNDFMGATGYASTMEDTAHETEILDPNLNIASFGAQNGASIFYNAASRNLEILKGNGAPLALYNIAGQNVLNFKSTKGMSFVNLTTMPSGIYVLKYGDTFKRIALTR